MNQRLLLLNETRNSYEAHSPLENSILHTCTKFQEPYEFLDILSFLQYIKTVSGALFLDVVPPLFLSCPLNIAVSLEKDSTAEANWTIPVASDNSNLAPVVTVSPKGVYPPHSFSETTRVVYTAVDSAGNIAKCSFKIEVEGWFNICFKLLDKLCLTNENEYQPENTVEINLAI